MSDVFLAVAKGMGGFHKLHVIKQLRPNLAEDEEFLAMFLDEARLAARLSHRNVVSTHEVGQDAGRYYIAMEYLEGQPLRRIVQRAKSRFGLDMRLHVVLEVLQGLHHAHELCDYDGTLLRVVHRDVSPHNIFVTYGGDVKVMDFGVAKALDSSTETSAGVMKGKLAYMSPEQALGGEVDRRADVFSVGVLLWEFLTEARMWKGATSSEIAERLMAGDVPRVRDEGIEVPDTLARICDKALAVESQDRYATALEMHQDLLSYVEASGMRVAVDDLGARVAALFADDRILMQTIIERQLHRLRDAKEDLEVEKLSASSSDHPPKLHGEQTQTERSMVASDRHHEGSVGRSWKAGALVVLLAAAVAAILVLVFRSGREAEPIPDAAGAMAEPSASAPRDARSARVRISVKPPEATVFLDGVEVSANPYEGTRVADGATLKVRAEAPGCVPETREIVVVSDVFVDMTLAVMPSASVPAPLSTRAVVPVATRPKPESTKRPIDSEDPWAR
jgi:serine/threonine-protein kinase